MHVHWRVGVLQDSREEAAGSKQAMVYGSGYGNLKLKESDESSKQYGTEKRYNLFGQPLSK
jgi:hypothetical protein